MTESVEDEAWARVNTLPQIDLADADRLARDYGLTIRGPDGDGLVWAVMVDPRAGVRTGVRLGDAGSDTAKAWLAWRDG